MSRLIVLKNKTNWFVVFLICFFISEALYKYLILIGLPEIRIAGIIKFLAQPIMLVVILLNLKENKQLYSLVLLSMIFLIGQISLKNNSNIIANIEYLNNSLFILIMLLFFNNLKLKKAQKEKAIKYFEAVIIINSIAILIGAVFSIKYLSTYFGGRFGFDGFLMKSSYASYFYLISVFYFSRKLFLIPNRNFLKWLLVIIAAFLTGTKAALLSVVMSFVYLFIKRKLYLKKGVLFVFILITLGVFMFSEYVLELIINQSSTFGPIINEHGIGTALFSFRDLILKEELIPYIKSEWTISNYLFGGMGDILIKSGFDVIDIVYFFGVIGTIVYYRVFYKYFFTFKPGFDSIFFITIIFIVSSLGGNFFYNSSLAIYLCGMKINFELHNGLYKDT